MEQTKKQHILDRNSLKLLILLLEDGAFEDQITVIPVLYKVILGHTKLITHQYDIDLNALIQTLTRVIFSDALLKKTFNHIIENLFKVAFKNTKKFHLEEGYQTFFKDALLVLDVKNNMFKDCLMYYLFTKRIQQPNYIYSKDTYLQSILTLDDAKDILNATDMSSLYFMRGGFDDA